MNNNTVKRRKENKKARASHGRSCAAFCWCHETLHVHEAPCGGCLMSPHICDANPHPRRPNTAPHTHHVSAATKPRRHYLRRHHPLPRRRPPSPPSPSAPSPATADPATSFLATAVAKYGCVRARDGASKHTRTADRGDKRAGEREVHLAPARVAGSAAFCDAGNTIICG